MQRSFAYVIWSPKYSHIHKFQMDTSFGDPPFNLPVGTLQVNIFVFSYPCFSAFITCFEFGRDQMYSSATLQLCLPLNWCEQWISGLALASCRRQKRNRILCNFMAMQIIKNFHSLAPSSLFLFLGQKNLFSIPSEQCPLWLLGLQIPVSRVSMLHP